MMSGGTAWNSRSAGAQARRGREAGGVGAERARRGRGAGEEELCVCGGAGAERVEQRRRVGAWRRSEGTGGGSRGRRKTVIETDAWARGTIK